MRVRILYVVFSFLILVGCKSENRKSETVLENPEELSVPSELISYYKNVDFNLRGEGLKDELAVTTIAKHTRFLEYYERHRYLYKADEDPSNSKNVLLIYSGESRDKREFYSGSNKYLPQTFNTEHVYPRSFIENTAEADLHHLRTADTKINAQRRNYRFTSGSGKYKLVSNNSWYPGDEWVGDVSRMVFYLNLRYNEDFEPVGNLALFLKWNSQDPVSKIEIQRNEIIFKAQGNRNPFIDNPYLATLIWGSPKAENKW
ncbi:endonuclease I [Gillisia sp. Hel_I_86]|uniref:endonuclease I family protein n=1 Tax=Gillisia sp. Hel_I_86 TaxID=1249981 RepID=UPI0011992ACB|nr:endonuclease [Gillisia sp. Hel_I_86]TVZ27716.1 endonuclease I [Gillisia sp. Hel_I_86]